MHICLGAKTHNCSVLAPNSNILSPTRQQFLTSIHRFFRQPRKRNKELINACTEDGNAPKVTGHLSIAVVGGLPDASQYYRNGLCAWFTYYAAVPRSPVLRATSLVSSRPARELLLYLSLCTDHYTISSTDPLKILTCRSSNVELRIHASPLRLKKN